MDATVTQLPMSDVGEGSADREWTLVLERAATGDVSAFEQLMLKTERSVMLTCRRMLGNVQDGAVSGGYGYADSHFSAIVEGIKVDKTKQPFRLSAPPAVKRPANLEDVAFWPVRHLGELIKTKQVTSTELTKMYLDRLHRYNPKLNFVVTFLDDLALQQARTADAEIAAGKYKGPLHGIPWGCKDIITVKGYKTTWGSPAFKEQVFDYDASIVEMLREAGAVLLAKLTTGELAGGDNWFGGQTKNPWDPTQGSSGSSAGPPRRPRQAA